MFILPESVVSQSRYGGVEDENSIIFQCGGRSTVDKNLALKYGGKNPKLIDSFRFVNRSFLD